LYTLTQKSWDEWKPKVEPALREQIREHVEQRLAQLKSLVEGHPWTQRKCNTASQNDEKKAIQLSCFPAAKPGLIAQQGCYLRHFRRPLDTFRCVRDRMSYSIPMVQLVVLGYAFGGAVKNLKLGIVDQDGHLAAVKLRECSGICRCQRRYV